MKRTGKIMVLVLALCLVFASTALAEGAPAKHGVCGRTFGALVSSLAQSYPGAVADHVSNAGGEGMGMPSIHGVSGRTFGGLVSDLAQSYPGAVADHVAGK
ncbi:MAG: hypothetical protein R6X16_03240 [Anaerolineae bacterium]